MISTMKPIGTALALLAVGWSTAASAAELEGVKFPATQESAGKTLVLNGVALYEATFMKIDIYVGGLYLEEKTRQARDVLDAKRIKRVVQVYKFSASQSQIQKGFIEMLTDAAGARGGALEKDIATYAGFFGEIKKHDRVVFDYVPQKGLKITHNKKVIGEMPDGPVPQMLFEIWVGATADPAVRKGYLSGR
jgi:hypothetical protein